LIEGEFPSYERLIPSEVLSTMTVDGEVFIDAIQRVRVMVLDQRAMSLTATSKKVEAKAVAPNLGESEEAVDCAYDGDELQVGFNPGFLIDGLKAFAGETALAGHVVEVE